MEPAELLRQAAAMCETVAAAGRNWEPETEEPEQHAARMVHELPNGCTVFCYRSPEGRFTVVVEWA